MPRKADDKIGYKNPPKHTRFKKGQSGNPRGRPKKQKTIESHIKNIMQEEMAIKLNGQKIEVTMLEALCRSIIHGSIELKPSALKQLSPYLMMFQEKEPIEQAISEEELQAQREADHAIARILNQLTEEKRNESSD